MIWFTSDTHFNHANIIEYTNRPFANVDEMNQELIRRWNEIVSPEDTIYHLGDVTLEGWKTAQKFLNQANGKIFIVPGGHDHRWINEYHKLRTLLPNLTILNNLFSLSLDMGGKHPEIWALCHYALRTWDRSHYGSFHLYGHPHGTLPPLGRSLDVSVECWDYTPVSITTLRDKLLTMPIHNPVTQ